MFGLDGLQITEAQVAEFGMTCGVGGFILFMLFIIANLAKESKAGQVRHLHPLLRARLRHAGLRRQGDHPG